MEKYISVAELQKKLGVSQTVAYRLGNTPGFPSYRVGKRILVLESEVDGWIRGNAMPADPRGRRAAHGGRAPIDNRRRAAGAPEKEGAL
jgi:excisionase family DNA binding protein